MKKFAFGMLAASAMLMAGCANDEPFNGVDTDGTVTFELTAPSALQTRAIGQNSDINDLRVVIFDAAGKYLDTQEFPDEFEGKTKSTVKVKLVKGESYKLAFWVDKEKRYSIDANGVISMGYDSADLEANDDSRDAYYATASLTVGQDYTKTVTLTRPFAQMNLGAADYERATTQLKKDFSKSKMVVKGIYNKMNLCTGAVSDQQATVTFAVAGHPAAATPAEALTVGTETYGWIGMNYLLVEPEGGTVNEVSLELYDDTGVNKTFTQDLKYTSVPVKRNFRTNIIGNLLTSPTDWTITLDKGTAGDLDGTVPTAFIRSQEDLDAALAGLTDGQVLNLICDPGTYTFTDGNTVTLSEATIILTGNYTSTRSVGEVVFDFTAFDTNKAYNLVNNDVIVNNGIVRFAAEANKAGLACRSLQINNSKVEGTYYGLSEEASFNTCDFTGNIVMGKNDKVSVTPVLSVNDCNFSSESTAIEIHSDGGFVAEVSIEETESNGDLYKEYDTVTNNETSNSTVTEDGAVAHAPNVCAIRTVDEFKAAMNNLKTNLYSYEGKTISLLADIDLENWEVPAMTGNGPYRMTLEGNGHTIKNFKSVNASAAGLFTYANACKFYNLTIDNANVSAEKGYAGALIGKSYSVDMANVKVVNSTVHGRKKVGGMVGFASEDETYHFNATNCHVENTTITTTNEEGDSGQAGGFVGYVQTVGKFTDCSVKKCNMTFYMNRDDRYCSQFAGTFHSKKAGELAQFTNCTVSGNTFTFGGSDKTDPILNLLGGCRYKLGTIIIDGEVIEY